LGLLLEDLHCKEYDDSLVLRGKGLNKLDRKRNRAIDINSDKCPTIMKSQEKNRQILLSLNKMGFIDIQQGGSAN
jgi:hypothetical protein